MACEHSVTLEPRRRGEGVAAGGAGRQTAAGAERDRGRGGALSGLLAAAPDAIVVIDEQGCIAALNELTEIMFGYRPG